jgi:hypothetical protein
LRETKIAEKEQLIRTMKANRAAGFYSPEAGGKLHLAIMKGSCNVVLYRSSAW